MDDNTKGLFRRLFGVKRYEPREGPLTELDKPLLEKPGEMVPEGFGVFRSDASRISEGVLESVRRRNGVNDESLFAALEEVFRRYGTGRSNLEQLLLDEGQSRDGAAFTGYKKGLPLTGSNNIDFEAIAQFLMEQEQSDERIDMINRTMIPGVDVFGNRKKVK
mgnify:CR=1 FL=1